MNPKLTCCIIEDEYLAQEMLEEYIRKVPFLELKGTYFSPLEAAGPLKTDRPDLLFLDINLPDVDGLSFIPMLNPRPHIILTTAYDQYALRAYDLEVRDYLLKPFTFERFYRAVLRLHQEQHPAPAATALAEKPAAPPESKAEPQYIFLKVGHRIQKVAPRDILYVEGMKDYLRIHTRQEKIMTLLSFARLEQLLPAQQFARVHRSFLVAIDKIDHIEKNRIQVAGQLIPISETYADTFYKQLRGLQ